MEKGIARFGGMDFVIAGIGAKSGLGKMFGSSIVKARQVVKDRVDLAKEAQAEAEAKGKIASPSVDDVYVDVDAEVMRWMCLNQSEEFRRLGLEDTFLGLGPDRLPLELADIEHSICEVDKYARVVHPRITTSGGSGPVRTRIRRAFDPTAPDRHCLRSVPIVLPRAWSHPGRTTLRIRRERLNVQKRYVIDKIGDHRVDEKHGVQYLVYWEGYGVNDASWEPEDMLREDAPDVLTQYLKQPKTKKARSRPASA
jgi:hypothetical protein